MKIEMTDHFCNFFKSITKVSNSLFFSCLNEEALQDFHPTFHSLLFTGCTCMNRNFNLKTLNLNFQNSGKLPCSKSCSF